MEIGQAIALVDFEELPNYIAHNGLGMKHTVLVAALCLTLISCDDVADPSNTNASTDLPSQPVQAGTTGSTAGMGSLDTQTSGTPGAAGANSSMPGLDAGGAATPMTPRTSCEAMSCDRNATC